MPITPSPSPQNPGSSASRRANHLQREQSPYLLQHAENPVNWFPWSEAAFALAKKEQQLIFLSIGYSTCHWCHVMAHESFEDREVAELLNRDFVSIKVDREERPDIDQFYMQVATRLTGQGGWPLTIIMTPEKIPLFAATYLPKQGRFNRPGLLELLPQVARAWVDHPQQLAADARGFLAKIAPASAPQDFQPAWISQAASRMKADFDPEHGGFGRAPKFPRPHQLAFLLQRFKLEGDPQLLQMIEASLTAMRNGGIFDQLGFGFHRYATDAKWLVPHFEKMLYDQAGLAEVYLDTFRLTNNPAYAATAREIFIYLQTRMRDPQGGFYSAEDADTEKVEGSTYLWTSQELLSALGTEPGARFIRYYGVREQGNFHDEATGKTTGNNILHRAQNLETLAREFDLTPKALRREFEAARVELLRLRNRRPQPMRDDKVLTAWNGMAISTFSKGAIQLEEPELLQVAGDCAEFLLANLRSSEGQLLRRWRNGQAAIPAFAEDYAYLCRGLLDLYHAGLKPRHLQQALELAEVLFSEFAAEDTIYISADRNELPQRTSERYDGAIPSTPSVALEVAARLAQLTGDKRWLKRAEQLLQGAASEIKSYPQGFPHLLLAAERLTGQTRELVIVGRQFDAQTQKLLEVVRETDPPLTSLLFIDADCPQPMAQLAGFTTEMRPLEGQATAYLCERHTCGRPLTKAAELRRALKIRPLA
jgi:hypothetical protein